MEVDMEVLHPKCAGLDVHRDTVVACVRLAEGKDVVVHTQTFGTTTASLMKLSEWLASHSVTCVAMEATGVYWRPVWHVLEDSFELLLVNALHIKRVPGRKTDVSDAAWLADLLAHGLVRASFVPPTPVHELRALTRTRKQLIRERASHVQRVDKILQDAGVKLGSVLTDIMGDSGRAILAAIVAGETDPMALASRVNHRVRASPAKIAEAVQGKVTAHHRFLLDLHLAQADALERAVERIDAEVGERLASFRDAAKRLITIPGVSDVSAAAIVSEIGVDMSRFPTSGHLISWAGLCPRSEESAGKQRSTRLRKGAPWLKTLLVQCARGASRAKNTYLQAQYYRLRSRRGDKKAVMAVAASQLTAVYFMLRDQTDYRDLGPEHFTRTDRGKVASRLRRRLNDLGFDVSLSERAPSQPVSS
jgi:transposase